MLNKYKLEIIPKCIKCKAPTKFYTTSENTFINTKFKTEWFKCIDCGNIQAKIAKTIGKTHGPKI